MEGENLGTTDFPFTFGVLLLSEFYGTKLRLHSSSVLNDVCYQTVIMWSYIAVIAELQRPEGPQSGAPYL